MKRIGIDIGGTFTDIVMIDEVSGDLTHDKVPSTPHDPSQAVLKYFQEYEGSFADVRFIMHGTTVATNAVIEGKGARVGLITTVGHKDRLDIQRTNLEILYDLNYRKPVALVAWEFRREVAGRTLSDGTILTPLDETEVVEVAQDLIENNAVQVICVCFINSYANPKQEQQVKDIIKQSYPKLPVLTSSETLAEFLEYERFSTTVVSAFLMPEMDKYLERLEGFFAGKGLTKERFMLMQGNGGVTGSFFARQNAALTVESGPAGGIVASQYIGSLKGEKNLITFDMGGTSTDVCLIRDGEPHITVDYKVAGHAMRFPLIDIISIGAGGGSIAWIDEGGGLHVGPQSAGANPGPACYGVGGEEPTVSDAHAVLGRLSPEILLGNRIKIKLDLAEKACNKIASKYNISIVETAKAIITIANENMFNALRVVSTERGVDPTNFTLIAYGGAGPMHSGMMMKKIKINKCIIPPIPGNHSSLGLISADIKHDYVRSILRPTNGLDIEWVHEIYRSLGIAHK
jgi:N-methylhydantoinase A